APLRLCDGRLHARHAALRAEGRATACGGLPPFRPSRGGRMNGAEPLLAVRDLKKHYPVRKGVLRRTAGWVYAVDGVSFEIGRGETLGLVGESGCGKSTAGKAILKLIEPTAGTIRLENRPIEGLSRAEMRSVRRELQVVFQDPYSSLNPRLSVGQI